MRQVELWRFLSRRYPDHVSVERVVSGPGIVNVYEFITQNVPDHQRVSGPSQAAQITNLAIQGTCPYCVETLEFSSTFLQMRPLRCPQMLGRSVYPVGFHPDYAFSPRAFPSGLKTKVDTETFSRLSGSVSSIIPIPAIGAGIGALVTLLHGAAKRLDAGRQHRQVGHRHSERQGLRRQKINFVQETGPHEALEVPQ